MHALIESFQQRQCAGIVATFNALISIIQVGEDVTTTRMKEVYEDSVA